MFDTTSIAMETEMMKIFIVGNSSTFREQVLDAVSEIENIKIIGGSDSALEAIREIKRMLPDVVILDIRLQAGTGLDVLHEIKREVKSPMTVIVMTNYPYEQYRRITIGMGADYFFHKSTEFAEMVDVLKKMQSEGRPTTLYEAVQSVR